MRIIAGKYKGQKLTSFDSDIIRPYTDRIKESVFSSLQYRLIESRVLDLFSGSGSIGLEAISRGAAFVQFNDASIKSITLLKKNIEKLKIEPKHYSIYKQSAERLLDGANLTFDIVFLDPPFAYADWTNLFQKLAHADWKRQPLIVARFPVKLDFELPGECIVQKEKKYGKSIVKYMEISK